jgi:hypothetical protein
MLLVTKTIQSVESFKHCAGTREARKAYSYSTPVHNGGSSDKRLEESQRFEQLQNALGLFRCELLDHPILRRGKLAEQAARVHVDACIRGLEFYVLGKTV